MGTHPGTLDVALDGLGAQQLKSIEEPTYVIADAP